jgi:hypothetical protein
MSDSVMNLLLGVAGVAVLVMLILRRRSNAAKTSKTRKPTIGRSSAGRPVNSPLVKTSKTGKPAIGRSR